MASYNKVILVGNLTRDPEVRYTPSGTAVAEVGLAVNRTWFDRQSNEKREETTFVDVTLWGRQAEVARRIPRQGTLGPHRRPPAAGYVGRPRNRQKTLQAQGRRREHADARRPRRRRRWWRRWRWIPRRRLPPAAVRSSVVGRLVLRRWPLAGRRQRRRPVLTPAGLQSSRLPRTIIHAYRNCRLTGGPGLRTPATV